MTQLRFLLSPPLLALAVFPQPAVAQDMPTRVEAVRPVERANQVSTKAGMFRTDVSFHAYAVEGTRSDGAIHRMFTPDGQYLESIYPPVPSSLVTRS